MDEEATLRLVAVSGPSIIYATAREIIATLSGRSYHGTLLLPSVSFTDQVLRFDAAGDGKNKLVATNAP
jgi:hypothetical protein